MKNMSGETRLEFEIKKNEKLLIQNLTRLKNFNKKPDALYFLSLPKLTGCKVFNSKSCLLKKH